MLNNLCVECYTVEDVFLVGSLEKVTMAYPRLWARARWGLM